MKATGESYETLASLIQEKKLKLLKLRKPAADRTKKTNGFWCRPGSKIKAELKVLVNLSHIIFGSFNALRKENANRFHKKKVKENKMDLNHMRNLPVNVNSKLLNWE